MSVNEHQVDNDVAAPPAASVTPAAPAPAAAAAPAPTPEGGATGAEVKDPLLLLLVLFWFYYCVVPFFFQNWAPQSFRISFHMFFCFCFLEVCLFLPDLEPPKLLENGIMGVAIDR